MFNSIPLFHPKEKDSNLGCFVWYESSKMRNENTTGVNTRWMNIEVEHHGTLHHWFMQQGVVVVVVQQKDSHTPQHTLTHTTHALPQEKS